MIALNVDALSENPYALAGLFAVMQEIDACRDKVDSFMELADRCIGFDRIEFITNANYYKCMAYFFEHILVTFVKAYEKEAKNEKEVEK